jgi:hypothetical protein
MYKRTHPGDPDVRGRFGIQDCMGRVRTWAFDAVIGVGGISAEPESYGLAGRVNWIGIGPHKRAVANKRGPIVTFDHFVLYGSRGPILREWAPTLASRMYSTNVRVLMDAVDAAERRELGRLLALAKSAPPSSDAGVRGLITSEPCAPGTRSKGRRKSDGATLCK